MLILHPSHLPSLLCSALLLPAIVHAEVMAPPAGKPLVGFIANSTPETLGFSPTSSEVTITSSEEPTAPGVVVTIAPGKESYPGIHFKPSEAPWDLSSSGHVQAKFTNLGTQPITCNLRVDGQTASGELGSNTEGTTIKPGDSGVAKVFFGFTYGGKPGAALKTDKIAKLVVFNNKSGVEQKFRIDLIEAGGTPGEAPPVKPENVRIAPKAGIILGSGRPYEEAIEAKEGAQSEVAGDTLRLVFPAGDKPTWVSLKPKIGRWDLRQAYGIRVHFKNIGTNPVSLRVKSTSNSGPTDSLSTAEPVAPGAEGSIEVPFEPQIPWTGIKDLTKTSWQPEKGTGTSYISDAVTGITFSADAAPAERSVLITSIVADQLSPRPLPEWLGKRPPVEGDWAMTFEENFDGNEIDLNKWNIYTENFWDKRSHFTKENVIVEQGLAKLRFEKKLGFHNDDPTGKQTPYATGFLDTYGKWVQRYGYFEARMKLTKAAGLWPAFWLMPDRGAAAGPQWKRASTENGAMEFDIMEHLGRWGPYRFNIAFHWDGYGKNHAQTGSTNIYFQPDKEGYVTSGLLWLPGLAVIYANGKEVARWESARISNVESDIMFTNVSGGWDNNAIDESKLPDDFTIDYVRAWQRKDLASPVDGPK